MSALKPLCSGQFKRLLFKPLFSSYDLVVCSFLWSSASESTICFELSCFFFSKNVAQ